MTGAAFAAADARDMGAAPELAKRPDAVEGLDAADKGRNGRPAAASAGVGSLQSSMTESRRD